MKYRGRSLITGGLVLAFVLAGLVAKSVVLMKNIIPETDEELEEKEDKEKKEE